MQIRLTPRNEARLIKLAKFHMTEVTHLVNFFVAVCIDDKRAGRNGWELLDRSFKVTKPKKP